MTAAQYFEQKGIQQGMQQGIQQTVMAFKMLQSGRFSITEIAKRTHFSEEKIAELQDSVVV
jgi:predicted transposase/invertase (TIGR01784 family)